MFVVVATHAARLRITPLEQSATHGQQVVAILPRERFAEVAPPARHRRKLVLEEARNHAAEPAADMTLQDAVYAVEQRAARLDAEEVEAAEHLFDLAAFAPNECHAGECRSSRDEISLKVGAREAELVVHP